MANTDSKRWTLVMGPEKFSLKFKLKSPQITKFDVVVYKLFNSDSIWLMKKGKSPVGDLYTHAMIVIDLSILIFIAQISRSFSFT